MGGYSFSFHLVTELGNVLQTAKKAKKQKLLSKFTNGWTFLANQRIAVEILLPFPCLCLENPCKIVLSDSLKKPGTWECGLVIEKAGA